MFLNAPAVDSVDSIKDHGTFCDSHDPPPKSESISNKSVDLITAAVIGYWFICVIVLNLWGWCFT